jgi:hypothetical protein
MDKTVKESMKVRPVGEQVMISIPRHAAPDTFMPQEIIAPAPGRVSAETLYHSATAVANGEVSRDAAAAKTLSGRPRRLGW